MGQIGATRLPFLLPSAQNLSDRVGQACEQGTGRDMTILVTGGAGYIGSHMVFELRDVGEKVVVLDDLSTGSRDVVPADVELVVGDVADRDLVLQIIHTHKVTAIAHFAAKIVVPDSVSDPLDYYLSNTAKTRTLIEAAVAGGVQHFIFSSTAAVYGEPEEMPVTEDQPLAPINPYGRSKLMTEWILRDVEKAHGLKHVILRYFNVAGADPAGRAGQSSPRATHLLKVACQTALGKRPSLPVFGDDYPTPDGSCLRDYIQVSDLARAHVLALEHLRKGGASQTLNCGFGRGLSVFEVIDVVKRVSGIDFPVEVLPRRAGDPAALVAATGKIRSVLNWSPRYDLSEMVAQALAWEHKLP